MMLTNFLFHVAYIYIYTYIHMAITYIYIYMMPPTAAFMDIYIYIHIHTKYIHTHIVGYSMQYCHHVISSFIDQMSFSSVPRRQQLLEARPKRDSQRDVGTGDLEFHRQRKTNAYVYGPFCNIYIFKQIGSGNRIGDPWRMEGDLRLTQVGYLIRKTPKRRNESIHQELLRKARMFGGFWISFPPSSSS